MPDVYTDIRGLMAEGTASIEEVVSIIELDSMLAKSIRNAAESRYFGLSRPVSSLRQAVELLGLQQLHDHILTHLCMRSFMFVPQEILNLRAFWQYSVSCGVAARAIGERCQADGHFVFFGLGLLHEIGHALLYLKEPEKSLQALEYSQSKNIDISRAEQELFGFSYDQVGLELMQHWKLPPIYGEVALNHIRPLEAAPDLELALHVVFLAHQLCQGADFSNVSVQFLDQSLAHVGLSLDVVLQANESAQSSSEVVFDLIWPRLDQLDRPGLHNA